MLTDQIREEQWDSPEALLNKIVNREIRDFIDQYAYYEIGEPAPRACGRRFPQRGDIDWAGELHVVNDGRHVLTSRPEVLPYQSRPLTEDETKRVLQFVTNAWLANRNLASGSDLRHRIVTEQFEHLWNYLKGLKV